jgi:hypothetical protein
VRWRSEAFTNCAEQTGREQGRSDGAVRFPDAIESAESFDALFFEKRLELWE